MSNHPKKCENCGEILIGRTDKRFCDYHCRNAFHNKISNPNEAFIKEVNKQLRKNRSVLRYACPEGKVTTRKSFLEKMGFDFKYSTHIFVTGLKNTYHFCYDYGYMELENDKVLIIQKQPYMD